MFETLKPETSQQELQIQAAKKILAGEFDEAVFLMKESIGMLKNENPFWVFQSPMTTEMTGISPSIGNEFLYNRVKNELHGIAAVAALKGDYGIAVQLMIEELRKDKLMKDAEALPEDLDEMAEYLKNHPMILVANESFIPSWIKDLT